MVVHVRIARKIGVETSTGMRRKRFSPRVDDVKNSCCDCRGVLWVKVGVSLEELQPRVVQEQFSDEWLQVVLHAECKKIP